MNNTKSKAYCRLCAKLKPHSKLADLQSVVEMCQKVDTYLRRFNIVMDFTENILPKTVCFICYKSLEQAFNFVTAVEEAQAYLSDYILVQMDGESVSAENNIFYEPPDGKIKVEIDQDPMDVNHESVSERLNDEAKLTCDPINNTNNNDEDVSNGINIMDKSVPVNDVNNENKTLSDSCNSQFSNHPLVCMNNLAIGSEGLNNLLMINGQWVLLGYPMVNVNTEHKNDVFNAVKSSPLHDVNIDSETGIEGFDNSVTSDTMNNEDIKIEYKPTVNSIMNVNNEIPDVGCVQYNKHNGCEPNINIKDPDLNNVQMEANNISKCLESSEDSEDNDSSHFTEADKNTRLPAKRINKKIIKRNPPKQSDDRVTTADNKQTKRQAVVPIESIKITWKDYLWKCSQCGTMFSNVEELQEHSLKYHNCCNAYQCIDCNVKKYTVNRFIKHVRQHRKHLQHSCYKCFRKFQTATATGNHKRKFHEWSEFVCYGCNKTFSSQTKLDEHSNKFYKNPKKVTTSQIMLNDYKSKDIKNRTKDFTCHICGKCFYTANPLKVHIMSIHNEVSILHQCEICKYNFKNELQLKSHAKLHAATATSFICDHCGKGFRSKTYIIRHMIIHTDSFPYSCKVCNKQFRWPGGLKNHMRQHTGAKPFACNICSRNFADLANRNKHMRRKHDIKTAKKKTYICDSTYLL